jgi:hypothetical protein
MSDKEILQNAIEVLRTAEIVNKFTDTVWIAVDRGAWDRFCGDDVTKENDDETTTTER